VANIKGCRLSKKIPKYNYTDVEDHDANCSDVEGNDTNNKNI
jgi:hypothetical protein